MAAVYHSLRTLCEEVEGGLGSLTTSIPMILVGREDMERRAERVLGECVRCAGGFV